MTDARAKKKARSEGMPGISDRRRGLVRAGFSLLIIGFLSACSVGPATIERDRFDYGDSLARSQREELLHNIIRLRYLESPVFMSIGSVVNQYSAEGELNAGFGWIFGGSDASANTSFGGTSRFYDRPTITYTPMNGDEFIEAYLRPISPQSLLTLVQSGYKIDFLFPLMLRAINNFENAKYAYGNDHPASQDFNRVVELMSRLQKSSRFRVRTEMDGPKSDSRQRFYFEWQDAVDPEGRRWIRELAGLLGLPPDSDRAEVVFGRSADGKITIIPRSTMTVLIDVSYYADVPDRDIDEGRVRPGRPADPAQPPPIRIRCSTDVPADAYVKIRHRDMWFWIDDCDIASKECFLTLVLLSNIADQVRSGGRPVLTLPAG